MWQETLEWAKARSAGQLCLSGVFLEELAFQRRRQPCRSLKHTFLLKLTSFCYPQLQQPHITHGCSRALKGSRCLSLPSCDTWSPHVQGKGDACGLFLSWHWRQLSSSSQVHNCLPGPPWRPTAQPVVGTQETSFRWMNETFHKPNRTLRVGRVS